MTKLTTDNIGINITPNEVGPQQIIKDLQTLGLVHVRAMHPTGSALFANTGLIAAAGFKFSFFCSGMPALQDIEAFETKYPGSVAIIEGPNEPNNFPITYNGVTGQAAVQPVCAAIYAYAKASSVLKDIPIAGVSNYPLMATDCDVLNLHAYPPKGEAPLANVSAAVLSTHALDKGKHIVCTEFGYSTYEGANGVTQAVQAHYVVAGASDLLDKGCTRVYLYQLHDVFKDATDKVGVDHYGLFDTAYNPKPIVAALKAALAG